MLQQMNKQSTNQLFQISKGTILATTNLRGILKDKAKSIREQRFKLTKQPQISYMPVKNLQPKPKVPTFNAMMSKITHSIKEDILKKNAIHRIYSRQCEPFATTFTVQKLNVKSSRKNDLHHRVQQIMSSSKDGKKSSSLQKFKRLLEDNKYRGQSDKILKYGKNMETKMYSTNYLDRKRKTNRNSNQFSRICRGSSFSRSKNSAKMLTEGSPVELSSENFFIQIPKNTQTLQNQAFLPLGNIQKNPKKIKTVQDQYGQKKIVQITECEEQPLKQIYDHIFLHKQSTSSNRRKTCTRTFNTNKKTKQQHTSSDQIFCKTQSKVQGKKRVKVFSQEKIHISSTVPKSSQRRRNQELGPWA